MIVKDIVGKLSLKVLAGSKFLNKEVSSGYCCDLLSWVMSHGEKNGLWITMQTHVNVVAVATLLDMACVVIPEDIPVDAKTLEKAEEEEIVILSSSLTAYELAGELYSLGLGGLRRESA